MEAPKRETDATVVKLAEHEFPLHDLIAERWSSRMFSDEPVTPEVLGSLLEAARWAPSSYNKQPWRFIVGTKNQPEIFGQFADILNEHNSSWASQAPVLILGVSKTQFDRNGKTNKYAMYDVGQAVAYLTIQATFEGLNVHQMGGFSHDRAVVEFDIPEGYRPAVMIAIGYPGTPESLPKPYEAKEYAPRSRKSLQEIAFSGKWSMDINAILKPVEPHLRKVGGTHNDN